MANSFILYSQGFCNKKNEFSFAGADQILMTQLLPYHCPFHRLVNRNDDNFKLSFLQLGAVM